MTTKGTTATSLRAPSELDGASRRSFRFKAFVSYSHAADGRLAPALQSALQSFTKPWHALRSCRIFRDKTTLAVTSALWPAIEQALLDSEYVLLLASPEAASSPWVTREVERFCEARPCSRMLLVLTGGEIAWDDSSKDFDWERTTALPRCLAKRFDFEPLFIDMRWARNEEQLSLRHPPFLDLVADVSSTLHNLDKDQLIGREVREHRRTRRIVQVTIGVLLTLVAATGALWFRAERALELAESRRTQARGVAETIAFDLNNTLRGVPEAAELRNQLNRRAEELLSALGKSEGDFRTTRAQMTLHAQKASDARKRRDLKLAEKEWLVSLSLAKQLSAQKPMNAEFLRDVSVSLSNLSDVAIEANDVEKARQYLEQDILITRQLLTRQPESIRGRLDLSTSLEKQGNLCVRSGKSACARSALEESLKIMQELHAQYPTNVEVTSGLAVALVQTGEMRFQASRLGDARAAYAQAVALNRELVKVSGADARASRDLSVSLLKLGDVDIQLRNPKAALSSFDEALALRHVLLSRNALDPSARRDVAVVLGRVASAHFQLGADADGAARMAEAIQLYEALAISEPGDQEIRRELAINLYDLAGAEVRLKQFSLAREHLARSTMLLRKTQFRATLSQPDQELFQALRRAGLVELELLDVRSAATMHEEACSLARSIPDGVPADQAVELILDLHQIAISHLKLYRGDRQSGASCAREARRRLELLRSTNRQIWEGNELQSAVGDLKTLVPD